MSTKQPIWTKKELKKKTRSRKSHAKSNKEIEPDHGDAPTKENLSPKTKHHGFEPHTTEDDQSDYLYLSYDIWHCISKYIAPEDVGRFASLCQDTAIVVASSQFWVRLYKRHYHADTGLPVRLQPDCMVRLCGLRANTIRALFYTYHPFVKRLQSLSAAKDIHTAEKKQLVTMWFQQTSLKLWNFYFKVKCKLNRNCRAVEAERKLMQHKRLEYLSDVFVNPDEGCQVLVLSTTSHRPLPQFFGQSIKLHTITQTLSYGFRSYKIILKFTSDINDELMGAVTFDPVLTAKVYDWWMPDYERICANTNNERADEHQGLF